MFERWKSQSHIFHDNNRWFRYLEFLFQVANTTGNQRKINRHERQKEKGSPNKSVSELPNQDLCSYLAAW